jgi:hypothetical protein
MHFICIYFTQNVPLPLTSQPQKQLRVWPEIAIEQAGSKYS